MRKITKLINKYYDNNFNHDTDLDSLKDKVNIKRKNKGGLILFMKTKKFAIVSTALFFLVVTAIVIGCSLNNNQTNRLIVKNAVITLDLNPSIEITVDNNGNISSVYGVNDEGKMIIIDIQDQLIGKFYTHGVNKILEVETDCGFFVKNTSNEDYNNLTITIDTEATENEISAMKEIINGNIAQKLTSLDVEIKDKITTIKNNTKESLVNKLLTLDESLDKNELNQKTHEELINLIAAYHIERINLPTKAIEEMYNNFKEYEIDIAESRIFKSFVSNTSSLNNTIIQNYDKLFNLSQEALFTLKTTYEKVFVNEDSEYVKAYNELLKIKAEVLSLRTETEALEDGLEKTLKLAQLSAKETTLLAAESALLAAFVAIV